ncbi:tyrosine-type recombinase/integrase [Proteus mirabilis]|uniref:tyrosine-type recombinase/integrase n=1 Tax=Proteus mirabilis TaxID=584 RepID=UPI000789CDCD|nr:integrase arm-type DNA-binding domain-containing protein [Proteus mirabilis]MBG2943073.1 tyrosine-type recombinase/integrase [Proteus mirabilis]MCL8556703.1 tyrosine-type recombinase/integrase [Proteus mirabilis]MCL8599812.1 tyrosine-type recombinase/integrase [Proteus mirabilis]MDF7346717.1 tyrosine-type recombinase/integrase [Proteus mirabilis]WSE86429.1 integrase arm-type DNA-binding domain-containing protein [Proteus mirabilis]
MPLTDIQIRKANPKEKPYTLNDGNGLSLLVEPNGSKGWRFRYRFAGKPKMISLGVYGQVTLAEARKKRDEAKKQLAENINPSDARKSEKIALRYATENTFYAVAMEWHSSKCSTWSDGYASEILRCFENDIFPYIGKRPIDQIAPLELLAVLQKIEKRGALEQANKIRRRCGEVFRYAVITGRVKYNPAPDLAGAMNKPETKHFPFLREDEIPDFVKALNNYQGSKITKYATQLLMLTGVRTVELRLAEWSEFDLDNAIWEIPKERMKKRRPHLVPLSPQVIAILNELKVITGYYPLLFPGRNDVRKPISEASINKVIEKIGYKGRLTGHGFRHMMSTILHEKGFDSAWIELQLAHVDKNSIRGIYNHALYLENRIKMMAYYSDYINNQHL